MKFSLSLLALGASMATAQQYAGDTISAYLPTISGAEVAFFKIPDTLNKNNNLTLINYYSHGSNGNRIVESNIKRAVIVIHGLLRDPWNYANDTLNALALVSDPNINKDSVAIMAPYFPNGNDKGFAYPWTDGLKAGRGSTTNALVWSASDWSGGGNNQYPYASQNTSSFYVLDTLIKYFDNTTLFPNVKEIVLVGHSLGGQTLQRYAAVAPIVQTNSPVTLWVGNPNSLAWLTTSRPLSTSGCSTYDVWRDGFTNYTASGMTYATSLVAQGSAAILKNFQAKRIAWARGTLDQGDDSSTCGPYASGKDRNERFFFFQKSFPASCSNVQSRDCDTVDLIPVPHDNGQMFHSAAGLARLFTDNFYGNLSRAYDFGYPRMQAGDDPYPNPALVSTSGVTNYNTYAGSMTYMGCWTNQSPLTALALPTLLFDNSTNTIEACASGCNAAGYKVAGVQNSTQCYCGNTVSKASAVNVVDDSCNLSCPGNSREVCGGPSRLSLFSKGFPTFA